MKFVSLGLAHARISWTKKGCSAVAFELWPTARVAKQTWAAVNQALMNVKHLDQTQVVAPPQLVQIWPGQSAPP
jgi:hypothetical protein